jgi:NAD+ kinase
VKKIGLLHHPKLPESQTLAKEIAHWLEAHGVTPWLGSAWDETEVRRYVADLDLLITLGGDGTILRAARMSARHGVPIWSIKLGRLSFLAEVEPEEWAEKLLLVLEGKYWLEERMMLHTEFWRGEERQGTYEALNDVVVSRAGLARVVHLATYVDGGYLTTYVADGVIVSTATGSTAYALAPHLSMDRAVVLSQGATVRVQVFTDHRAILTVDGQFEVAMEDADSVVVMASPYTSRFVRLQDETKR